MTTSKNAKIGEEHNNIFGRAEKTSKIRRKIQLEGNSQKVLAKERRLKWYETDKTGHSKNNESKFYQQ